ncbi:kinase-like protein [Eremomyces bilateralis CBS 781.70]|uniref:ethanolamine kinase n=1 Tax=Eremomyces bilateralis CBS 781.70 TaxID=1392243 RepID=A0A6G1GFW1_9PEZI|nr:kinase-like protein [Eremomyces bilateralis CBS 781.70]KAF1816801.1 kinase-like protein [Eremomyces bilateralis CBS 781.70]
MASKTRVPFIPLSYRNSTAQESDETARALIHALRPEWDGEDGKLEFVRFTDGITNTEANSWCVVQLMKAIKLKPGLSSSEVDSEAILLRAYGEGTDILIDRNRELLSHSLLADHSLAPALLARFSNGLLYRFIIGTVCSPADLRKPPVYHAVARRLAEWHTKLPVPPASSALSINKSLNGSAKPGTNTERAASPFDRLVNDHANILDAPTPNLWTVLQGWVTALPCHKEEDCTQRTALQRELAWLVETFGQFRPLVFAHCDLLSGNVIVLPKGVSSIATGPSSTTRSSTDSRSTSPSSTPKSTSSSAPTHVSAAVPEETIDELRDTHVTFIDYEYATPAPASFDLANHFAEWGGFDCDYSVLPTRRQRRDFLRSYLTSVRAFSPGASVAADAQTNPEEELDRLTQEVDLFRGLPGFYWGIWALIQAQISQIDFDYAEYAIVRLQEYWDWKKSAYPTVEGRGKADSLRERRWQEEE